MAVKAKGEDDVFRQERRVFLSQGGKTQSEQQLRAIEQDLFATHSGTAGIKFGQYKSIEVERSGT